VARITLRLPDPLHKQLQELARGSGVSLNEQIVVTLSSDVKRVSTAAIRGEESEGQPPANFVKLLHALRDLWLQRGRQLEAGRATVDIAQQLLEKVAEEALAFEEVRVRQERVQTLGGPTRSWEQIGAAPPTPPDLTVVTKHLEYVATSLREVEEALTEIQERASHRLAPFPSNEAGARRHAVSFVNL